MSWDPENPLDPTLFRHESQPGDFELESLQLEDVLVTVYQPESFRPYTASIFRADIQTFRKRWLFYDFLCAENVVGQFDNCLFSLHKPQSIGRTNEKDLKDGDWVRMVCVFPMSCSHMWPELFLFSEVPFPYRRCQHRPPSKFDNYGRPNIMDYVWQGRCRL